MRYLNKHSDSLILSENLSYEIAGNRTRIRSILLNEQKQYCAYSEKFICAMDETHIEHFNPQKKGTHKDGYYNWYATLPWMNSHKAKLIDDFLPILIPSAADVSTRIVYNKLDNQFESTVFGDIEAENLIRFLGFNKREVTITRERHIRRIQDVISLYSNITDALQSLANHKDNFSFITALEAILDTDLTPFIDL